MAEPQEAKAAAGAVAAAEQAPAKPKSNLMMIIIVGLAITVVTPVATFFVVKATMPPPVTAEQPKKAGSEITADLGELYVNIAETKGTRVLKIQPVLVLSDAKLQPQIEKLQALMKDRIIMVAGNKTIDDLEGANGKDVLKREIVAALNTATKEKMAGAITDIYFTQFLIQ